MKRTTVILAAGDFPRKGSAARQLLESASRVVCCDSAADTYRRAFGFSPSVVVGDCDSVRGKHPVLVRYSEQDDNDLEKAIRHCAECGWTNPVILGAMGKRADHAFGNLFLCMERGLEIVTDDGRFIPFNGKLALRVGVGTAVSVFATPDTRMTSQGLEWPLDDVRFANFHCATLNRATKATIKLTTTRPAYLFVTTEKRQTASTRGANLRMESKR